MEVTYENKPEDIAAILYGLPWNDRFQDYWRTLKVLLAVWPLAVLFAILSEWFFLACLLGIVGLCALLLTILYWRAWASIGKNAKVIPGPQTVRLLDDYLEATTERGAARRRWNTVPSVRNLPDYIAIYVQKLRAYVVPKRYFSSPDEADAFVARAESLRTRALENPSPLLAWEAFRQGNDLDQFQLIEHLKWDACPELYARLTAMGIDTDGKNTVPTAWGLIKQLILPIILAMLLIVLRYQMEINTDFFYYLALTMTSILLLVFGLQWHSRLQFLKELSVQQEGSRPDEAWFFDEGVATVTEEGIGFSRWSVLDQVADDREAIVIYDTMPFIYLAIPKTALPDPEKQSALFERLKQCVDIAHDRHEEIVLAEVTDNPFQSPST
ncbi:YcxB family protein [Bremerella sp. P1]|uniref:YcxB family protein n=1 Tax=Bremerella sp. P1 TaxID=3026424 RepID=UPI002368F168|nr:YcxB family protein [Bremerella sp. P1]WDI44990.1 YcxB family protein [Bremerella sp. P1]